MLSIFLPKYFRIRNTEILKSFHQEFVRNNPFEFQKPLERKWKFHPLKRNHILYSFHKPSNDLICPIYYHTLRNVKHFYGKLLDWQTVSLLMLHLLKSLFDEFFAGWECSSHYIDRSLIQQYELLIYIFGRIKLSPY